MFASIIKEPLAKLINMMKGRGSKNRRLDDAETLEFYATKDWELNRDTTPPDEERIDLICMWAVEFYTASHMDNLAEALLRFDENAPADSHASNRVQTWVSALHRPPFGGSWMNLGLLEPEGQPSQFTPTGRKIRLPDSVSYATAGISRISPSIISIAVCFVFNEDLSSKIDKALRKDRKTYTEPFGNGYSIFDPRTQKKDEIESVRSTASQSAAKWFRDNLPGAFSSGLLEGRVPVCDFMTLRYAKPFPKIEKPIPGLAYLRMLELNNDWWAWQHTTIPELKFSIDPFPRDRFRYHSTLSANEKDCLTRVGNYLGHEGRGAMVIFADGFMPRLVTMWAVLALLDGYAERLNKLRNSIDFRLGNQENSVEVLRKVNTHLAFLSDVSAVSDDLIRCCEQNFWALGFDESFSPCRSDPHRENLDLSEFLRLSIMDQATWLRTVDQSIRGQLVQFGSIVDATENLRLQKTVSKLTRVIVVLTLITLLVALVGIFEPPSTEWPKTLFGAVSDHAGRLFDSVFR